MDQYWNEMTEETTNVLAKPVISKERRESIISLFGKGDKDNRRPSNTSSKSANHIFFPAAQDYDHGSNSRLQLPTTRDMNVRRESNMSVDFMKDYNDIMTNSG